MVRRLATVLLVLCSLVLILSTLLSWSEEKENKKIILVSTSLGVETVAHKNFINKLLQGTQLDQDEKKALIAHELGHAVYEFNFIENLQIVTLHELGILKKLHNQILTKYQIKADKFSAENTSPAIMVSLLNKLYVTNKKSPGYKIRLENLNRLKQGRVY